MSGVAALGSRLRMRRLNLLGPMALVLSGAGAAGPTTARPTTLHRLDGTALTPARVDSLVVRLMSAAQVTGVGIAMLQDGSVAYLHAYGQRDVAKRLALTPNSVMTSASLSKAAFATLVMQ